MVSEEAGNAWADVVGPCYTQESVQRVLGVTRSEVEQAACELRLVALPTSDNVVLYPAWQMLGDRVVDGLSEVLAVLSSGVDDPWTWAQFLAAVPVEGNDDRRHIDALRDGDIDVVLLSATHAASAWRT